jgi:hypothetical protein
VASVGGGSLPPVYYFIAFIARAAEDIVLRLILRNTPTWRERTIMFETGAYISYNLKFVY